MNKEASILAPVFGDDGPGYDDDFSAWAEEQARRIRALRIPGLDVENVAEEIESLSRSDKRELRNRLRVLLMQLLKWRYQPLRAGRSWSLTISEQRQRIAMVLEESPSLRPRMPGYVKNEYPPARSQAADQTMIDKDRFPPECEWSLEQLLSLDFLPAAS